MLSFIAQVAPAALIKLPSVEYGAIAPELIMIVGALVVILVSSLSIKHLPKAFSIVLGTVVGAASLLDSIYLGIESSAPGANKAVLSGSLALDRYAIFFYGLFSLVAILTIVLGLELIDVNKARVPEFVSLVLLSSSGAMFMASALDLIVLFLGLEILSIGLYVLVAIESGNALSRESAIKYFMLGGFASAVFLYGVALVYGATGSTNLGQIAVFFSNNLLRSDGVLFAGLGLILVGLGFKVSAVPFHFWTPDVYQGAPSPISGYMAATAKAAGFAALFRVFIGGFSSYQSTWVDAIGAIAVVTLLAGAVLAVVQTDVKRTLAYSSINQAGFILLGLYAASASGTGAALYYVAIYSVVIVGAFATVGAIERELGKARPSIEDLRGLSKRSPFLAFAFVVLMLAQAGAPLTTGFLAKFNVVLATVNSRHYAVALAAMISAAIAVFFYLRLALMPYRKDVAGEPSDLLENPEGSGEGTVLTKPETRRATRLGASTAVVIIFSIAVTVGLGIVASPLIELANRAVLLF